MLTLAGTTTTDVRKASFHEPQALTARLIT
jgi:hypothetical protein